MMAREQYRIRANCHHHERVFNNIMVVAVKSSSSRTITLPPTPQNVRILRIIHTCLPSSTHVHISLMK